MGSYRLRPTIAGETAGEGTIAMVVVVTAGEKDGGIVEGIILVDEVGCRVEMRKRSRRIDY